MDYSSLGSFMNPFGTPLGYTRGLQFTNPAYGLPLGGTINATLASATQPFAHPNLPTSTGQQQSPLAGMLAGWTEMDPNAGLTAYHPIQSNARAMLQNYLGQL